MKPFNLEEALSGKAVKLRDGRKAYVRYHETELNAFASHKLLGYLASGELVSWSEGGYCTTAPEASVGGYDIIGMYPETRMINGFEVPAPETEAPEHGTTYYLASPNMRHFHSCETWDGDTVDKYWLERGLVFLNEGDAVANTKAMLGIDPYTGEEE